MDVAASAVSLIQFSITGLKVIQRTFSAVQDGPELVTLICEDADGLLYLLERLENSAVVKSNPDGKLKELMDRLQRDLLKISTKLEKVCFKPEDKRPTKLWKAIRSAATEKELGELHNRLCGYSGSINTFLAVEYGDRQYDIDNRFTGAHTAIEAQLVSISTQLQLLDAKRDDSVVAKRDQKLQESMDHVRQNIEILSLSLLLPKSLRNIQLEAEFPRVHLQTQADDGSMMSQLPSSNKFMNSQPSTIDAGSSSQANFRNNEIGPQGLRGTSPEEGIAKLHSDVKQIATDLALLKLRAEEEWYFARRHFQNPCRNTLMHRRNYSDSGSSASSVSSSSEEGITESLPPRHCTLTEITLNSRCLEAFFAPAHIRLLDAPKSIRPAFVTKTTLRRLTLWTQAKTSSKILWLKAPFTQNRNTQNNFTRVGLRLVNIAHERGDPVRMMSFFCRRDPETKTDLLTSIVYALIHQLLPILHPHLTNPSNDIELSEARLKQLDGSKNSLLAAFQLLESLISHLKDNVFCVLDGMQLLDQGCAENDFARLLEILRHDFLHVLIITTTSAVLEPLRGIVGPEDVLGEAHHLRASSYDVDIGRHAREFWRRDEIVS